MKYNQIEQEVLSLMDRTDFKNIIVDGFCWKTSLLKKADTIIIEAFIHHSDSICIPETQDNEEENINGSVVDIRVSILGK